MIIHIVGKPRQGKGILATMLGLIVADAGKPVDSNYHLKSVDGKVDVANCIQFYDLLNYLNKPRQEPPHLLIIDELPGWCDSYVTQTKSSRFATHFLNQSAKLGYDLIFTSQRTMRADINFRELSDVRLEAVKNEESKMFEYYLQDVTVTDQDVRTGQKLSLPFDVAASFWSRYDTFEAVPPIGLNEVLTEMEKFDLVRLNNTVYRQAMLIKTQIEKGVLTEYLTLSAVKDVLLELGEPVCFAAYVHARVTRLLRNKSRQIEELTSPLSVEPVPIRDKWKQLLKSQ